MKYTIQQGVERAFSERFNIDRRRLLPILAVLIIGLLFAIPSSRKHMSPSVLGIFTIHSPDENSNNTGGNKSTKNNPNGKGTANKSGKQTSATGTPLLKPVGAPASGSAVGGLGGGVGSATGTAGGATGVVGGMGGGSLPIGSSPSPGSCLCQTIHNAIPPVSNPVPIQPAPIISPPPLPSTQPVTNTLSPVTNALPQPLSSPVNGLLH